jgi:nucleoside-diphosphate-sugar epimerase
MNVLIIGGSGKIGAAVTWDLVKAGLDYFRKTV